MADGDERLYFSSRSMLNGEVSADPVKRRLSSFSSRRIKDESQSGPSVSSNDDGMSFSITSVVVAGSN